MASNNSGPRPTARGSISSVSTDITGASVASALENGSGLGRREGRPGSVGSRGHSEAERNRQIGGRDRSGARAPKFKLRHIQMMAFGSPPLFILLKLQGGRLALDCFTAPGLSCMMQDRFRLALGTF